MIETISSSRAIRMVRSARNALLSSQVAALDLAKLSDTEAARLDFPENRARRLADAVGRPDMPIPVAMNLFEAAESFVDSALRRADEVAKQRRKERLSESSAEATASTAESEAEFDDQVEEAKEAAKAASTALSEAVEAAGLSRRAVLRSILTISKMRSEKSRSVLMLESLLISSVAQFELFASRLIATSLRFDTSPLAGDRTFTLEEFVNHDSVSSFMKSVRDSFVDSLMRESLEKWMKFLARATRSDTEWITDLLEEVVMRRNVHVHAGGRATAQYLKALGKKAAAVRVGDVLPVTADYLQDALDRIARATVVLSQAAISAIDKSNRAAAAEDVATDADESIVEVTFDLLVSGRYAAVAPLAAQLEPFVKSNSSKERIRANSFVAGKNWMGIDAVRAEIEGWDVSAAEDELVLAKLCLLEDLARAEELYLRLLNSARLTELELATWPVLEPLRQHLEVRDSGVIAEDSPDMPSDLGTEPE